MSDKPLMQQDDAVHVQSGHAPILVQIDKSVGKQFVLMIWVSAVVTAVAVVGLFVAFDAYRHMRQHVNVLQYDLIDLRAKTGHSHENTDPE